MVYRYSSEHRNDTGIMGAVSYKGLRLHTDV